MPGRPVEAFFEEQLEAQGGWDSIFERKASGETQTEIARSYGVSQGWLSRIIDKDPERAKAWKAAKEAAAQVYADEAKQILDECPPDRDAVALARERSGVRRWLSSVYDRKQFGEAKTGIEVNLNVGELHLASLRHREVLASISSPQEIEVHEKHAGAECFSHEVPLSLPQATPSSNTIVTPSDK